MDVVRKQCNNCGHEYATWNQDELRANLPATDWLDLVCKHCACLLRDYHRWSITDQGRRICADCFILRLPLVRMVAVMQKINQAKGAQALKT